MINYSVHIDVYFICVVICRATCISFVFVKYVIVYHCILFVIELRDFGDKRLISTVFIIIIWVGVLQ